MARMPLHKMKLEIFQGSDGCYIVKTKKHEYEVHKQLPLDFIIHKISEKEADTK